MFSCRPSVCGCVCPSRMLFLQYLWYALIDFYQTFVTWASSNKDELVRFRGKRQGHSVTKYAKNTIFGVCFRNISAMPVFLQTFVASSYRDKLIGFCGQKVKGYGHWAKTYIARI